MQIKMHFFRKKAKMRVYQKGIMDCRSSKITQNYQKIYKGNRHTMPEKKAPSYSPERGRERETEDVRAMMREKCTMQNRRHRMPRQYEKENRPDYSGLIG